MSPLDIVDIESLAMMSRFFLDQSDAPESICDSGGSFSHLFIKFDPRVSISFLIPAKKMPVYLDRNQKNP